jgi:hypothetical protein
VKSVCLAISILASTACATLPDSYPPTAQREPALLEDAPRTARILLRMIEPETGASIVRDIPLEVSGPWRWTGKRPTVRIYLTSIEGLKAVVEYSVAEATLKQTGPVTFQFFVNGHLLGVEKQDKPGNYRFEKAAPATMLEPNAANELAVEVDKPFVAPEDGAKLGFILTTIGFTL